MTAPLAHTPLRAVVVDDTPDLRALLVMALENSGEIVVVGEAGNGLEGVERVQATQPDLVLIDLAMPVMDGLEALPHLRRECPDATIVVFSGFGSSTMAARAVAAGADGYLQKGVSPAAILDYVRGLVGYAPAGLRLLPPATQPVSPERVSRLSTELAPIGVLVAEDDDGLTLKAANPRANVVLGTSLSPGMGLSRVVPELARLVQSVPTAGDETHDANVGKPLRWVSVRVRRSEDLVFVYVEPAQPSDGADLLRRAIATTAHEIRNPVTVLVGIADTLRERGDDLSDELRIRLRGAVVRQARLLDSITADLLTAAQAHRGTLRVDLEVVDAKEVLGAVVDGQFDDVEVLVDEPSRVLADPLRLEQMLTNLLSNARKYGEPPVVVHLRPDGPFALIEVEDHGPGVPEAFRTQLFDEFTRAGGTHARGTGLGLYVVRSLAEAQGGTVGFAPHPAGGSVFTVRLPAAE